MRLESTKFRPREVVKHVLQTAAASMKKELTLEGHVAEDVPIEVSVPYGSDSSIWFDLYLCLSETQHLPEEICEALIGKKMQNMTSLQIFPWHNYLLY